MMLSFFSLLGKQSYADSSSTAPHPIFSTSSSTTKVSVKSEVIKTDASRGSAMSEKPLSLICQWASPFVSSGIFSRPDHAKMTYPAVHLQNSLPLFLICDNLRDPGNLGTILRSAAGAGCSKVLLTKGRPLLWRTGVCDDFSCGVGRV